MPIRPENRARYPKDWKLISARIRFERAGGRCECTGQCGLDHEGRCDAWHGDWQRADALCTAMQALGNPDYMKDGAWLRLLPIRTVAAILRAKEATNEQ